MKQIKVNYHDEDINGMCGDYHFSGFKTAVCTKPENYKVTALTSFEGCREVLTNRLRAMFAETSQARDMGGIRTKDFTDVDRNRLRLLLGLKVAFGNRNKKLIEERKTTMDKQMQVGLKLLNHFEKRHRWGDTKLYKTDNDGQFMKDKVNRNNHICVYMVVSSKRWMKSPTTVSLHALLLRLGFLDSK